MTPIDIETAVVQYVRSEHGCKLPDLYRHFRDLPLPTIDLDRAIHKLIDNGTLIEIEYTVPLDADRSRIRIFLIPGGADIAVYGAAKQSDVSVCEKKV